MSEQGHAQTVRQMYEAFGRGDIQAILNQLADDVTWVTPGHPSLPTTGRRRGKNEVAKFFTAVNDAMTFDKFEPRDFISQGERVVALGSYAGTGKPTGKRFEADWAMVWTFRGGKVAAMQEYTDTAATDQALLASAAVTARR